MTTENSFRLDLTQAITQRAGFLEPSRRGFLMLPNGLVHPEGSKFVNPGPERLDDGKLLNYRVAIRHGRVARSQFMSACTSSDKACQCRGCGR